MPTFSSFMSETILDKKTSFLFLQQSTRKRKKKEPKCLHQANAGRWIWWNCKNLFSFLTSFVLYLIGFVRCFFFLSIFNLFFLGFDWLGWWVITKWKWSMMACKSFMWNSMDLKKVSNQNLQYPFFLFTVFFL